MSPIASSSFLARPIEPSPFPRKWSSGVTQDPYDITPIVPILNSEGDVSSWIKDDTQFQIGRANGGKTRGFLLIAQNRPAKLIAPCTRYQPLQLVEVGKHTGLPVELHFAQGKHTPELDECYREGATMVPYRPGTGRASTIACWARRKAEAEGATFVPWGCIGWTAVIAAQHQGEETLTRAAELGVKRILIPVGSGIHLSGILRARVITRSKIPIHCVQVGGGGFTKNLEKFAPSFYNGMFSIEKTDIPYGEKHSSVIGDIRVGSFYESRLTPIMRDGDLFWNIGSDPILEQPLGE